MVRPWTWRIKNSVQTSTQTLGLVTNCMWEFFSILGANRNTKRDQGISELYDAASEGDIECVKVLLRSGTDPSIKTDYDWAPLHWAASKWQIEIVKLLIEAGAEKSPVSDQPTMPLDMTLQANQFATADLLSKIGAIENRDVKRLNRKCEDPWWKRKGKLKLPVQSLDN